VLIAAVAVYAATVGTLVAVRWFSPATNRHSIVTFQMHTATGRHVGETVISNQNPPSVSVAFNVASQDKSGTYHVLAVRHAGAPIDLGTVQVASGRGGIDARTSVPLSDIIGVEVISPDGNSFCSGGLPDAPPSAS
jgi:hypothetical protein